VRLFNPLSETIAASLDLDERPPGTASPGRVGPVDLESNALESTWPMEDKANITLRPKEIITLRLR
jgi:hypothetical protein